ncbi:hypothetical protein [Actinokineospora diospyrosa]|uniref:Uncharacterized protein n=1 Tax=Actinokineospora diospyrosa TaxID=103728 RepID=A0ABT1I989_9PSEU|nr:hypothetical protein [Actinokineospora diospyrosa]MCP2268966.1 hypothetical protein [Actinokineospora diospyrosa]
MTDPGTRLANELALLLTATADHIAPWLDRIAATPPSATPCQSCPLCALVAVLRGEPNELAATGIDRLADLVALLRAVLADRWTPGDPHMPGFQPDPPPSGRVQHIPIRKS